MGRPKGRVSITRIIQEKLKDRHFQGQPNPDDMLTAECLVEAMIVRAMEGNSPYMKELIDRNDGKIPDAEPIVDVSMENVAAIQSITPEDVSDPKPGAGSSSVPK